MYPECGKAVEYDYEVQSPLILDGWMTSHVLRTATGHAP